jgi:gas vesicle protein
LAKKETGTDFIIGTIVGGVIGAATALFLAPKAGKELRENLNKQIIVAKDKSNQIGKEAYKKGIELAEYAKDQTVALSQSLSELKVKSQDDDVYTGENKTKESSEMVESEEAENLLEEIEETAEDMRNDLVENEYEKNKIQL